MLLFLLVKEHLKVKLVVESRELVLDLLAHLGDNAILPIRSEAVLERQIYIKDELSDSLVLVVAQLLSNQLKVH